MKNCGFDGELPRSGVPETLKAYFYAYVRKRITYGLSLTQGYQPHSLVPKETQQEGGAWVAQSVKRPTSAQVTISRSVSSSPESGSGLMAQSLEPVSDSVSPSLSAPPPFMLCLKNK